MAKSLDELVNEDPKAKPDAKPKDPEPVEAAADTATDPEPDKPEAEPKEAKGPQRGPDGKFQPKAEAPKAEAKPEPEGEADEPDTDPKNWTYSAYKDEKEKRKAYEAEAREAKRRADELERRFQEMERQRQMQSQPAPDPIDDPKGYTGYLEQQFQTRLLSERLNMSEMMARQSAGDEAVDAALTAIQSAADPSLRDRILQARNPYGELLNWHKRQQAMAEIGDDPAAWREREIERLKQELLAEMNDQPESQAQPQPSAPRPVNMSKARNAGPRTGPGWNGPKPITDLLNQ